MKFESFEQKLCLEEVLNALDSSNASNKSNYWFSFVPDEEDNRGPAYNFCSPRDAYQGSAVTGSECQTNLAKTLVDTVAAKHRPDLIYLGSQLTPQSSPDAIIFAATDRSKIGHKSSCGDLHVIEAGTPILEMKGKSSTVLEQLHDKTGKTIGLTVVGLRFGDGEEAAAAKLAKQIGDELDQQISSKEELFEPGR